MDYPDGHEDPRITERDRAWARIVARKPAPARNPLALLLRPVGLLLRVILSPLALIGGRDRAGPP